jgi:hypothetical protein
MGLSCRVIDQPWVRDSIGSLQEARSDAGRPSGGARGVVRGIGGRRTIKDHPIVGL